MSNQFDKKSEAWSALFSEPTSELVKRYTASVTFDQRLWRADIAGSRAHAEMLATQGVISASDLAAIQSGLTTIAGEIEAGSFKWQVDLEDVHLNIEARLIELAGDAGKRLHTGRSRNDQIATDVRLWLRDEIRAIATLLGDLQMALVDLAELHTETILPGFTHLQVAQPVSFAHHLLAYVEMFSRDAERMKRGAGSRRRLPLRRRGPGRHQLSARSRGGGQGPGQGRHLPPPHRRGKRPRLRDRVHGRRGLVHGARLALRRGAGAVDEPELRLRRPGRPLLHRLVDHAAEEEPRRRGAGARRKSGRVIGHLMALLVLMKGQPLAYNKDNQEDKEPLFDGVDTLKDTLRVFSELVPGIEVKAEAMEAAAARASATATDLAGLPGQEGACPFATRTKRWRAPSSTRCSGARC